MYAWRDNTYVLIRVDRTDLDIHTEEFPSKEAAHDKMLKEILEQGVYESVEELIDDANAGEAGYSDSEAWIHHPFCEIVAWKIIIA